MTESPLLPPVAPPPAVAKPASPPPAVQPSPVVEEIKTVEMKPSSPKQGFRRLKRIDAEPDSEYELSSVNTVMSTDSDAMTDSSSVRAVSPPTNGVVALTLSDQIQSGTFFPVGQTISLDLQAASAAGTEGIARRCAVSPARTAFDPIVLSANTVSNGSPSTLNALPTNLAGLFCSMSRRTCFESSTSFREFEVDLRLIADNCRAFNEPESEIVGCANRFEAFALSLCQSILS